MFNHFTNKNVLVEDVNQNLDLNGKLPKCFLSKHSEFGERQVADKFTKSDSCVLEIGGGAGNVSTVVQRKLNNKKDHVVIQPMEGDNIMFGGLSELKKNKSICNSEYQIIDHVLAKGEGKKLLGMVSKPFDTIIVDCEGCLTGEYEKNPELFDHVTQIQVERDDCLTPTSSCHYEDLFNKLGMKLVHIGLGCGTTCETHVYER